MKVQWIWTLPLVAGLFLVGCTKTPPAACPNNEKQTSAGKCVQCLVSTDCGAGTYCDSSNSCSTCTASTQDCPCKQNTDCPTGDFCSSGGTCSSGCRTDTDCTDVLKTTCCGGVCTNTTTDATANCGGCGNAACTGNQVC